MNKLGLEGNWDNSTFREQVMLIGPTVNDATIFSAMLNPAHGFINILPVDSDYPDVGSEVSEKQMLFKEIEKY